MNFGRTHIKAEPVIIFQFEHEYLDLNIVDQFWQTQYISLCDEPPSGELKATREAQTNSFPTDFGPPAAILARRLRRARCGTAPRSGRKRESGRREDARASADGQELSSPDAQGASPAEKTSEREATS